jgi:membrane protein implicated in regulation of membrane protease activity
MRWRPAQPEYGAYERAVMRGLFALVVALHMPGALPSDPLAAPNGLARLVDLSFLSDPTAFSVSQYLLWAALILYVLRIAWGVVLPYITFLSLAVGSLQNSRGAIGHHLQIVSLVLLAQTAAYFYSRFVRDRDRKDKPPKSAGENRMINWSQQAIAATYLVSGLAKLINSHGMWVFQSPLVAVQIVKTTEQDYYNTLDPNRYGAGLATAEWIVQHPLLVTLMAAAGLILELTAPLMLLGRRWALFYGLGLVLFHESIHRVMKLHFANNEYLIWIYLVNVPFWVWVAACWLRSSTAKEFERQAKMTNDE